MKHFKQVNNALVELSPAEVAQIQAEGRYYFSPRTLDGEQVHVQWTDAHIDARQVEENAPPPTPKLSDQLKATLLGAIAQFKEVLDPEDAVEMRAIQKKLEEALPDFEQLYGDQAQIKLAQVAARKLEAWVNPSGDPMLPEMDAVRQGMVQACEAVIGE
jgi:hypothetical protein